MRTSLSAIASSLCALIALTATVHAQQANEPSLEELQQQLTSLQQMISSLEGRVNKTRHVTELGSSPRYVHDEPQMVTRIYELSDLFAVAPTYPAMYRSDLVSGEVPLFPGALGGPTAQGKSTGFGGGGGFFSVGSTQSNPQPKSVQPREPALNQFGQGVASANDTRASLEQLIDAITQTIDPVSWDEVGGPGSIAKIGNSLLISAEPRTHDKIEALLTLFRQRWGTLRTVSIRAHWLWLDDGQLEKLILHDQANKPKKEGEAYGLVDGEAWEKLMTELEDAEADVMPPIRAAVTCYNGQTVHTLSGTQDLAVTQIKMAAARDEKENITSQIVYQPVVSVIQEGAALQVTPVVNTSGKYVVLDIHSLMSAKQGTEQREQPPAADAIIEDPSAAALRAVIASIDRPRLLTHRLSTTLRVPVDQLILVGGMTVESDQKLDEPHLYLFVKASVQELRDDIVASRAVNEEANKNQQNGAARPERNDR